MKKKNVYPEWAEKFRAEGKTIRKVRNGYGLYECTWSEVSKISSEISGHDY